MQGKHKNQREGSAQKRNSSAKKAGRDSQQCSVGSSQRRSFAPETSHLQELTKSDYRKKVLFLNRYIDDLDRFAVLDRTLQPQSPVYSLLDSTAGSEKRKVALQTENNYFVTKINQLQMEVASKNKAISQLESMSKAVELEREQLESERVSMKRMIELLNR